MPKKLGEFIHAMLVKAGQSPESLPEPTKNFFADPALLNIDVPDELVTALDNNLLSIPDALNNHSTIKKHYDKQALDGVDAEIGKILEAIQDEDTRATVLAEKSTYKRLPILVSRVKELEAKRLAATNKPDRDNLQAQKDAFQKQIDDLVFKLKTKESEVESVRKESDKKVAAIHIDSEIRNMLNTYKTVWDDLNPGVKAAGINAIMSKELADNEAEFYFDDKNNFAIRKKDGTNYLGDNHQQIMPQAFIESLLSRNKLLKVTTNDQPASGDNNNPQNTNLNGSQNPVNINGNGPKRNHTLSDLVKQAQKDINQNANSPVL